MKKRVLSLILALVMVIGIFPVNVLAAEADELTQAPQTVAIETSLDAEMADGVFTTAENPLAVKVRASADGGTVAHTAALDGETLDGTPEDEWTVYALSFAEAGSHTLTICAEETEQSRTIVYQPQAAADEADENAQINARSNGADTPVNDADRGEIKGYVRVIVENNTAALSNGVYGNFWMDGATPWNGTHIDRSMPLYADSTAMGLVVEAVATKGYKIYANLDNMTEATASSNYVAAIDGLKADTSTSAGWMVTLNDWFTAQGIDMYTVGLGNLKDGDEIRAVYTVTGGSDVGSIANKTDKKLSALTVTGGTLNPTFSGGNYTYELVIGDVDSATVGIVPTAFNKNFLACVFNREVTLAEATDETKMDASSWYSDNSSLERRLVRRNETVTVKPGDVLTVVVGAPNWPSMNNGKYGGAETVDPCIYTITVVKKATDHSAGFDNFFTALSGVATAVNDTEYPLRVDADENALVSTNAGKGNSDSGLTLTFSKTAKLTFKFKTSGESYDYLNIEKNKISLVNWQNKSDFGGEMTAYKEYSLEVQAGDVIWLGYHKDFGGDEGSDCVWLKDFTVTLPNTVTFHANDGTETTTEQGVFGSANLNENTFTREGYRFDGWATSAGSTTVAYKDEDAITLTESINLYAVWTKVWQISFPNMPKDAAITVKQGGVELPVSATAKVWIVPNGSYTYSAELFGYVSKTDIAFEVKDADYAVSESLDSAARTNVTFAVGGVTEGTEVTITVLNSEKTTMQPKEAGGKLYELPAGEYTYSVTAKGYKSQKNQTLTVTAGETPKTVNVTLIVSNAWDGTAAETLSKSGDVYQIRNGAELAKFAELVNGGETAAKAVLTADIVLNEPDELNHQWTPIGTDTNKFTGTFDGSGHSITGLYIDNDEAAVGLFGYVGAGGTIRDLTITGASVKSTNSNANAGLAAASNAGTISGVKLESSKVSGCIVGGVAGLNTGTVTGCGNESAVVEQCTKKDKGVGGIVGQNDATVRLCYNKAQIVNGHGNKSYGHFGGVVGNSTGVIENCYNRGTLNVAYYVGGIVGKATGSVSNCYNAGTVPSGKKALVGSGSPTVTDCYYLDTCGASDSKGISKTAVEFKSLAGAGGLGGAFENTETYPILKWEDPNATFSITLTVKPANAVVTVANAGGTMSAEPVVDATANTAAYTYSGLRKGSYTWSVSCDTEGTDDYSAQSGSIVLSTADEIKTIELAKKEYEVKFTLSPANASLTLTTGAGEDAQTIDPTSSENGVVIYSLPMGSYHYKATAFGYGDVESNITIDKGMTGTKEQPVTLTKNDSYDLRFTDVPAGAVVTVTHETGGVQQPESDNANRYKLVPATYSYTVKLKGYKTVKGVVTITNKAENIAISMQELTAWDGKTISEGFAGGYGTAEHPYEIESGEDLAYLSQQVNAGDSSLTASTHYIVTADIDLGSHAFTPIGMDRDHLFSGYFDGSESMISNFTVTRDGEYTGLFGYTKASISNLTIENATVSATGNYTGVLAGGVYAGGSLTNCVVKNSTVNGTASYTGGLAGYAPVLITKCAVEDTNVTGKAYVGGLVGQNGSSNSAGTSYCYALRTNVTATGDYSNKSYAGGLVGGGTAGKITDCFVRGGKVKAACSVAGGIIGDGASYSNATVQRSYAVVDVTTDSGNGGLLAGGTNVNVTNAFYCSDSTLSASGSVTKGTAKTAAELKDRAILTSLGDAFEITVDDGGSINAGYPYLKTMPMEKVQLTKLTAPSVRWSGKTAEWSAVENAQGYLVVLKKSGVEEPLFSGTMDGTSKDFTGILDDNGTGSYIVSVTALGDGEYYGNSDAATANTDVAISKANVTITVTPESGHTFAEGDPVITLTRADGTTLLLGNGTAKSLALGHYTYTVKAKMFTEQSAEFDLTAEGKTFNIQMVYATAWDGVTTVEPAQVDGVYQISNGYELAWFRDKVNTYSTNCALNAILTDNIDLGGHDWVAISKVTDTSAKKGYTGTFNGNGKTVSGLAPVGTEITKYGSTSIQGAGLFGYVYNGAVIKDLTVAGEMRAVQYSGGVAAILAGGTVENCVSHMHITAAISSKNAFVGGIVGNMNTYGTTPVVTGCRNEGVIELADNGYVGGIVGQTGNTSAVVNCVNTAAVSGKDSVGGIVGRSAAPITASVNTGAISGKSEYVGGIAGFAGSESVVTNCWNSGTVTGAETDGVGGIAGYLYNQYKATIFNAKIVGCLNTGSVSATGLSGAIAGTKGGTNPAVERSYYLNNTSTQGIGSNAADTDAATPVTDEVANSRRIAGLLGGEFAVEANGTLVLKWQSATAKPVAAFILTPADASVEVKKDGTAVAAAETGVFVLDDGDYSYTVSRTDYDAQNGTFTVAGESQSIAVELANQTYTVTFSVTPVDAVITVRNASDEVVPATAEDSKIYKLPNGNYTYTVSKFGFTSVPGSFTVDHADYTVPAITLTGETTYAVTLTFKNSETGEAITVPADDVTITAADGTVIPTGTFRYTLPNGEYTCAVNTSGYYAVSKKFAVNGEGLAVEVGLEVDRSWDGTTTTQPRPAEDGYYEIGTAAELAWFAQHVNGGSTGANARLTRDIYINYKGSTNTWTSIGKYGTEYEYAGTFDGCGKTVHGLTDSLFGFNAAGSTVKNVTVEGSASGSSNVGGVCKTTYGSIENCVNSMTLTATNQRVGGIAGILYSTGSITNCVNEGAVSSSYQGWEYQEGYKVYLGGIAGYAYGSISGSVNKGNVAATAANYGGVGGIAGELTSGSTITNCYNTGTVSGPHRVGGIVGIANATSEKVTNCYSTGTVTATSSTANPFIGAIAGSIANSDGAQIGSVTNCYYLTDSCVYGGKAYGVGYPGTNMDDPAVVKSASEMKLDAFAAALGGAFNKDTNSINNGYPVLAWQGGTAPSVSDDERAVAADKAALTVEPPVVTSEMTLNLPSAGENETTISWASDKPEIINSTTGKVTLPTDNVVKVTLTATIKKGSVSDTKTFTITVKTQAAADEEALARIVQNLSTNFRVPYSDSGANVNDVVKQNVLPAAIATSGVTGLTADDITVTVSSTGSSTYGNAKIAADGTVTYYYADPSSLTTATGDAYVQDVIFRLTVQRSGRYADTNKTQLAIPWDQAKVKAEMQKAAVLLTFADIKGDNTDQNAVTQTLNLPASVKGYGWASITWRASDENVISISGSPLTGYTGTVTPPKQETEVTLTATFTFNRNNTDDDGKITVTKNITVKVSGTGNTWMEEINAALDRFTLESLKYLAGANKDQTIDSTAVTDNIQLPRTGRTGLNIAGGPDDYKIEYSAKNADGSKSCPVTINGYAANVVRPISETPVEVILTLTITKQNGGVLNYGYTGSKNLRITIAPVKPSEIQKEINLLDMVKQKFFEGINHGVNAAADAVTMNLDEFYEAYLDESNKLAWIYTNADMKDIGIVPMELPGGTESTWYKWKSSNNAVIAHNNLLVTPPATTDASVTVTTKLKSVRFGGYYDFYKDDANVDASIKAQLQRLAGEEHSVTLTVISTANQNAAKAVKDAIDKLAPVTKDSGTAIDAARTAYDNLSEGAKKLVENYEKLTEAETEYEKLTGGDTGDQAAADAVIAKIKAIGEIGESSRAKITEAENAYNALDEATKKLVGDENHKKLTNARSAQTVYDRIEALFPVTAQTDKSAIGAAQGAYEGLNPEAKALLPKAAARLEQAWKDYADAVKAAEQEKKDRAAAKAVDDLIDAIGDVTLDSESKIVKARNEFTKLNETAKRYVKKLPELEAAEAKLNELKNAQGYEAQLSSALAYLKRTVDQPQANENTGAEWAILSAARFGCDSAAYKNEWYAPYADNLAALLKRNGGRFSESTNYERVVLALTALGQDAMHYKANGTTYDLVTPLTEKTGGVYKATVKGTTSTAFAIIALDSRPYSPENRAAAAEMVAYLVGEQMANGAWYATKDKKDEADVDATAMVLTALARHRSESGVEAAITKALSWLAGVQGTKGYGTTESNAQVVVALSALGIDCTTGDFVKGSSNPLTALLSTQLPSGGFMHASSSVGENAMSTEQAAYALVAYYRFKHSQNSLFNMSDAVDLLPKDTGAADVVRMIEELGTVTDCKRSTYLAIAAIEAAYDRLTDAQRENVTNYQEFLRQKARFQTLLDEYRTARLKELEDYYGKLKQSDYTTDQWNKITEAYRTGRAAISSAQYAEQADAALSTAKADMDAYVKGDTIEVSFRLIGDFPESYTSDHLGYVNWIETESYTLKTGSTVYDLFTTALKQAGLSSTGAEKGYVRSITAPAVLGGYTLSEFDNGSGSGWMFTVNGTHGNSALTDHVLKNGDRVVWHYVDNYATEEKKFTWLEAEDITPSEYVRRHISDVAVAGKNGSIEPTLTTGDLGRTVTFKFKPDAGYRVRDVKVNGKSVGAVDSYTYSGLKIYSRITVEFTNGTMPFTDVHTNDWFYNDVAYVYEAGLFAGTSDTTFSPYASMTRGMLVTVLYRLEGRPSVTGTSVFDDVARGAYYEKAVIWAAEHKIVNGTGGSKFSPDANVTREQMAAILYRYAQYKGYRTNSRAGLSGFADYQTVSSYAETPMQWAVAEKLINGSNGSLLPRGNATRAQVAAILHRFVENIVK